MAGATGVYPCYENQFQIDKAAAEGPASYVNIADCETFGVAFDNNIEEWTPFDTQGWVRRLMTGKRRDYYCYSKEKRRRRRK